MGRVRRDVAAAGSAVFFAVAPGTVAGLLPWWLTRWRPGAEFAHWLPARLLGILLLLVGTALLVHAFAGFVVEGIGTPAPVAPPAHLVVGGLYRYVRNPMYLAVIATILGQALLLWRPVLLIYAALAAAAMVAFVVGHEQPALARTFGGEYTAYRRAVPGWWPRLTPWTGPRGDAVQDAGPPAGR
jgi:protein-S-isoprenylcysteine O-methyltransferase Ste14